jgi:hypothetical protein
MKMTQDRKVEVSLGDQVRSTDPRSDYFHKIGTVTSTRNGVVKVTYGRGQWERTGPQWFTWVAPASGRCCAMQTPEYGCSAHGGARAS